MDIINQVNFSSGVYFRRGLKGPQGGVNLVFSIKCVEVPAL